MLAEAAYREHLGRSTEDRTEYPDWAYRKMRTRPLLMIHLIDLETNGHIDLPSQPVVAWGMSFPATYREETRVEYLVNTTWLRENFGDDVDEDEMQGDDV